MSPHGHVVSSIYFIKGHFLFTQFASDRTDLVKRIEHLGKRKSTQGMTLTKISKNIPENKAKSSVDKFLLETRHVFPRQQKHL